MRFVLLLAVLSSSAAWAQTPDTTAAWRYFPLEIGDEWRYEWRGKDGEWVEVWSIPSDTLVDARRYVRLERAQHYADGGLRGEVQTSFVRFDTASASIRFAEGLGALAQVTPGCPLDTPFDATQTCELWGAPFLVWVGGGYGHAIAVGTDTVHTAVKTLHTGGAELIPTFAADIGLVAFATLGGGMRLRYARVGSVEYGTPFAVADEPAPPVSAFSVSPPYPNPAAGGVTLDVAVPTPGTLPVEAFDVLGRRVWRSVEERAAGASPVRLDVAGWASGVYLVRATHGGRQATQRLVVP